MGSDRAIGNKGMTQNGTKLNPVIRLASISTDYYQVAVGSPPGGVDPTDYAIQFAFVDITDGGEPTDEDWHNGAWLESTIFYAGRTLYVAQILIGPDAGGLVLEPGTYLPWTFIAAIQGANPRQPVNGQLTIFTTEPVE